MTLLVVAYTGHCVQNFLLKSFILTSCFFLGGLFYLFTYEWFDFSSLENYDPGTPSVVLDADGKVLTKFELDKRSYIDYQSLPEVLIKAFVAAEDHSFFSHNGISLKGVLRSFLVNLYHRRFVQGASTITQQLSRLLFLTYERKLVRKIKEMFLAMSIERHFTKEQIMELYLNNIYFGRGIYGVEAACRRFWNKSVRDVNTEEAATLAAVAKSARFYSPLNAPLTARKRRNIVLRSMNQLGFISKESFNIARKTGIELKDRIPGNPIRLYIQEWIRTWAENIWDREALYKGGLKIKTTINTSMQEKAENAFRPVLAELRKTQGDSLNGGMLSLEVATGKIRAAIGGLDFNESQYNHAFQAFRQMGSSFKPIIYAAALQKGVALNTLCIDEPIELDVGSGSPWKPRNWRRRFDGPMTLIKALSTSNNMVTIKTFLHVGAKTVIDLAKKFGIVRELNPYPSLALGTAEATVEENTAAFNVFANHGHYVKPHLIEWVKDRWGVKMWKHEGQRVKILDSVTNSKMVNALSVAIKRRKKFFPSEHNFDFEAIGKSGSTNNSTSNWYVGSTPELTTAVYVGRDDGKAMGQHVFSSQTAYPIWANFKKAVGSKEKTFYFDPSLKEVAINWITGEEGDHDTDPVNTVSILK